MKYVPLRPQRILALDPISRGFGFVVLETAPLQLVDWGITTCRRRKRSLGKTLRLMLARYRPTLIVIEDPRTSRSYTRREALRAFVSLLVDVVDGAISVRQIPREHILRTFESLGATTKEERLGILGERFPELAPKMPPPRHLSENEDTRWAIFDALACACTAIDSSVDWPTSSPSHPPALS